MVQIGALVCLPIFQFWQDMQNLIRFAMSVLIDGHINQ